MYQLSLPTLSAIWLSDSIAATPPLWVTTREKASNQHKERDRKRSVSREEGREGEDIRKSRGGTQARGLKMWVGGWADEGKKGRKTRGMTTVMDGGK